MSLFKKDFDPMKDVPPSMLANQAAIKQAEKDKIKKEPGKLAINIVPVVRVVIK